MTRSNLSPAIDAYGRLVAQIKELEKRKDALQGEFRGLEEGTYEGEAYILKITDSTRETPDKIYGAEIKAATEAFKASKSHQYLKAHVTQKPVRTHTATHRTPVEEVED